MSDDNAAPKQKRKYTTPKLKYLGSVRDLTTGNTLGCLTETSVKFPKKRGRM